MKKPLEFAKALQLTQKFAGDLYPVVRVTAEHARLGLDQEGSIRLSATDSFTILDVRLKGQYGTGTTYIDRWAQVPVRGCRDVRMDDGLEIEYYSGVLRMRDEGADKWASNLDKLVETEIPERTEDDWFNSKLMARVMVSLAAFGDHPVKVYQLNSRKPMKLEMLWEHGSITAMIMPVRVPKELE